MLLLTEGIFVVFEACSNRKTHVELVYRLIIYLMGKAIDNPHFIGRLYDLDISLRHPSS